MKKINVCFEQDSTLDTVEVTVRAAERDEFVEELISKLACEPSLITVSNESGVIKTISPEEIYFISVSGRTADIVLENVRYSVKRSLQSIEEVLDSRRFIRISRYEIINITKVRQYEYTKKECTRCHDVVEEYGKYRSENGQHDYVKHWVHQLTCTEDGESDGEFCSICGQKNPASKEEYFEHQGHKVKAWVQTFGKVRNGTTRQGTPIELTNYRSVHECVNCGAVLGIEEWTVATCSKPPKLEIASGANAKIDDISGGIHISGNMANDGGVTFNQIVLSEVTEFVNDGKISSKYTYKKTKSHSFIIEFSKMFLDELEDGTYPVEIVNGHEYWPLMVTVEDHKLVAVSDQEYPIGDEITKAQLDEHLAQAEAEGAVIKELFVVPLAEEDLDGMVFPEAEKEQPEEPDNESENDSGDPERSDDDGKEADNSKAEGGSASSNPNTGSTAPAMCAAVILLGAIVMTHKRKQR